MCPVLLREDSTLVLRRNPGAVRRLLGPLAPNAILGKSIIRVSGVTLTSTWVQSTKSSFGRLRNSAPVITKERATELRYSEQTDTRTVAPENLFKDLPGNSLTDSQQYHDGYARQRPRRRGFNSIETQMFLNSSRRNS